MGTRALSVGYLTNVLHRGGGKNYMGEAAVNVAVQRVLQGVREAAVVSKKARFFLFVP